METITKKSPSQELRKGISWNESLMTTGFPEIDAQHKEWISRFNSFVEAINDQRGKEIWEEALLFFIRYTENHFGFEETLMKKFHCPSEELNQEAHGKFKDRIHEIAYMTWPLGATPGDLENLEKELGDWLIQHIYTIDGKLRAVAQRP